MTVYLDFVDRPQYQHVQNIVTLPIIESLIRHVRIAEVYCSCWRTRNCVLAHYDSLASVYAHNV